MWLCEHELKLARKGDEPLLQAVRKLLLTTLRGSRSALGRAHGTVTAAALAALEEMGSEIPLRGRDPKELMAELFFVQESIGDSLIFASTETTS